MDPQERERAQQWFGRWGNQPCPLCHTQNWLLGEELGQLEYLTPLPAGMGGSQGRYPVFVFTCQTCGYFRTVNAIISGIRQPPYR